MEFIKKNNAIFLTVFVTCLVSMLSINSQSLWIDEFGTWKICNVETLAQWYQQFVGWYNSDTQIPLYHFYMFIWAKFAPLTEVGLRLSNALWYFVGVYALLSVTRKNLLFTISLAVAIGLHSMLWYYMNEARPYIAIFAGSALAASWFVHVWSQKSTDIENYQLWRLIAGLFLLVSTSIIGVIWSISFLILLIATIEFKNIALRHLFTRFDIVLLLVLTLVTIPIAIHYLQTVLAGVGATKFHENKLINFAFAFYELFSVSGFGPGRDELRVEGVHALESFLPQLLIACVAIGALISSALVLALKQNKRLLITTFVAFFIPIVILFILGEVKHWRVVGRHCFPLILPVVILYAMGIYNLLSSLLSKENKMTNLYTGLLAFVLVSLTWAAFQISHSYRHQREEYRPAFEIALTEAVSGHDVWWVADSLGFEYYSKAGMGNCDAQCAQNIKVIGNMNPSDLMSLSHPDIVIISRKETYDPQGAVTAFLSNHKFVLVEKRIAFEIWHSPPSEQF